MTHFFHTSRASRSLSTDCGLHGQDGLACLETRNGGYLNQLMAWGDRSLSGANLHSSFSSTAIVSDISPSEVSLSGNLSSDSPNLSLEPGLYDVQVQATVEAFNTATPVVRPVANPFVPQALTFNRTYGYGLVDAAAAVAQALNPQNPPFPNVPNLGGNNWGLDLVKAPEAWARGYTGQGITVAVIDTGVDYTHPDLDGNIWTNPGEIAGDGIDNDSNGFIDDIRGWDFVNDDNNPMDQESHGTHVAGTIAAENNGTGITGVAYNAKIMPIRVLGPQGGSYNDVAAGIRYAADKGARVINLSLGGGSSNRLVEDAVKYAISKGAVVVMASGNEGQTQPGFPANVARTGGIAVGAVDRNLRNASFSNKAGQQTLDYVVAPGVGVLSTTPGNTYQSFSGTSMATPHVAGVAALILSANPNLTPTEVETLITRTATTTGIRA